MTNHLVPEDLMTLHALDFVNSIKYLMKLRKGDPDAIIDDLLRWDDGMIGLLELLAL